MKLAKHYEAVAARHEAEAKEHDALAAEYSKNPTGHEQKHPMSGQTAEHCKVYAEHCRKAAAKALADEEQPKTNTETHLEGSDDPQIRRAKTRHFGIIAKQAQPNAGLHRDHPSERTTDKSDRCRSNPSDPASGCETSVAAERTACMVRAGASRAFSRRNEHRVRGRRGSWAAAHPDLGTRLWPDVVFWNWIMCVTGCRRRIWRGRSRRGGHRSRRNATGGVGGRERVPDRMGRGVVRRGVAAGSPGLTQPRRVERRHCRAR